MLSRLGRSVLLQKECVLWHSAARHKSRGFTMIELLISLLLMGISIMGFSALQSRTMQETLDTQQRSVALWRANGLIDRIAANNSVTSKDAYVAAVNGMGSCPSSPATSCSAATGSTPAECTQEEMADYDVWSALCSSGIPLDQQLINFDSSLSCAGGACAVGTDMTLVFSWLSKAVDSDTRLRDSSITLDGAAQTAAMERITLTFRP